MSDQPTQHEKLRVHHYDGEAGDDKDGDDNRDDEGGVDNHDCDVDGVVKCYM